MVGEATVKLTQVREIEHEQEKVEEMGVHSTHFTVVEKLAKSTGSFTDEQAFAERLFAGGTLVIAARLEVMKFV